MQTVRLMRRNGYLNPFVSVSLKNGDRSISVACDGGRLCRPYVVVEHSQPQLTQAHIDVRGPMLRKSSAVALNL